MSVQLRMTRSLCDQMRRDLVRPHPFAAERIGFARAAFGAREDGGLVLLKSYWAVPDNQYVRDPYVGARINGTAIRNAMQDVLDGGHGLFHVHLHDHKGETKLSRTDEAEIPKLVNSFRNVGLKQVHGFLVLSIDHGLAYASIPNTTAMVPAKKIAVVGYPLELLT